MSDIVERLRNLFPVDLGEADLAYATVDEAAAEIVALRAALDDIAENRMPDFRPDGSRWWFDGGEGFVEWATEYARQALRRSDDDG